MSPRYPPQTLADDPSTQAGRIYTKHRVEQVRARIAERDPYGPTSPHSWVLGRAATADGDGSDPRALERLNRARAATEKRAMASTAFPWAAAAIPPYVAEAVSYGVRSTAPLAAALLRLDLPPTGTVVSWAKVTTGATITNQSGENAPVTASADIAAASAQDAVGTIAGYVAFSVQEQEMSGGWFDRVVGEELGRAFGSRLEQQIWAGTGANQQLKGLTVMTGNSSSTVSGQTMPLFMNKVYDQFQQVSTNLGEAPDIVALAPRRYAMLGAAAAAFGLDATDLLPDELTAVVSPAAPLTLGGGTEDWAVLVNRAAVPLVQDAAPTTTVRIVQQAGTSLQAQWVVYGYAALGVSRRPEGVGIVKGATTPTFT